MHPFMQNIIKDSNDFWTSTMQIFQRLVGICRGYEMIGLRAFYVSKQIAPYDSFEFSEKYV